MKTYQEIQVELAELQGLAAAAREKETSAAREKVTALMREHGLTIADVSGKTSSKGRKSSTTVAAKYRDEATGKTSTGRGKAPKSIVGKDRSEYLIK